MALDAVALGLAQRPDAGPGAGPPLARRQKREELEHGGDGVGQVLAARALRAQPEMPVEAEELFHHLVTAPAVEAPVQRDGRAVNGEVEEPDVLAPEALDVGPGHQRVTVEGQLVG